MQYRLVKSVSIDQFLEELEFKLSEGWQLQGGISITWHPTCGAIMYAQAIIQEAAK